MASLDYQSRHDPAKRSLDYFRRWNSVYEQLWRDCHVRFEERTNRDCSFIVDFDKEHGSICCGAPVPLGKTQYCTFHAEMEDALK